MNPISPAGWAVLICFGSFILFMNIWLLLAWVRRGTKPPRNPEVRPKMFSGTVWDQEDRGAAELSRQVEMYRKTGSDSDDQKPE